MRTVEINIRENRKGNQ